MTPCSRIRLKSASGWFAAGREVEQALLLLSDGAFRLFVWICLRAGRSTGSLDADANQVAQWLGRSAAVVERDLRELVQFEVCEVARNRITIRDRFWPYHRESSEAACGTSAYVGAVRRAFLGHACVAGVFAPADEALARVWERRRVPLETVERAITLGVARKYIAWLNHRVGTPITSLEYFTGILDEVAPSQAGADYWTYVTRKVASLEVSYRNLRAQSAGPERETK